MLLFCVPLVASQSDTMSHTKALRKYIVLRVRKRSPEKPVASRERISGRSGVVRHVPVESGANVIQNCLRYYLRMGLVLVYDILGDGWGARGRGSPQGLGRSFRQSGVPTRRERDMATAVIPVYSHGEQAIGFYHICLDSGTLMLPPNHSLAKHLPRYVPRRHQAYDTNACKVPYAHLQCRSWGNVAKGSLRH
jgi:hypothetical protein